MKKLFLFWIFLGIALIVSGFSLFQHNFTTGNIVLVDKQLDAGKLSSTGYQLNPEWNVIIWPDRYDGAPVEKVLESINNKYWYVYGYEERKYFVSSEGAYSKLRTMYFNQGRILEVLRGGNRYAIKMLQKGILKYG